MAAVHFVPLSFRQSEISSAYQNYRNPISFSSKKKSISLSRAVNSPESSSPVTEKPEIQLEFVGPKPGPDGLYPIDKASAISGEKLLRNIMLENKIEIYATYGKVMNCGGVGSCGTCIVEIIDGKDLLNERTNTELRYLKKACLLNPNLGGSLVKLLLEIKKILERLWFSGCPSGRNDSGSEPAFL
ncbi:hypothetical protein HHK36_025710 [Tetracentron sinense]|uniref:2Fe-2S ferredoxin-type domain-containing protein n=1 Tax=Tetracentron sinense TaxID=13715 RepID=A0A834YLS1_TETSI|nr:hypothetical protein HHK36_025710 [Tetracentron sinense]